MPRDVPHGEPTAWPSGVGMDDALRQEVQQDAGPTEIREHDQRPSRKRRRAEAELSETTFRDCMRKRLVEPMRGSMRRVGPYSMPERMNLYNQGALPRQQVWGVRPPNAVQVGWESREMLDAAGLIVDAVYITCPESVQRYLEKHPNPKTTDGQYRPWRRYQECQQRKHLVADVCRQYWRPWRHRGRSNREPGEPFRRYLQPKLVEQCVQRLLREFRNREYPFKPPFPQFEIPEADYTTWQLQAIQGVQKMLEIETEELALRECHAGAYGRC